MQLAGARRGQERSHALKPDGESLAANHTTAKARWIAVGRKVNSGLLAVTIPFVKIRNRQRCTRRTDMLTITTGVRVRLRRLSYFTAMAIAVLSVACVVACTTLDRLPPVSAADTSRALPLGLTNVRFT